MSCYKTSQAGLKNLLVKKGIVDTYYNVLDLGRFRSEVTQWSNYANSQYGITERLFFDEQNGTKAVPNERAFQIIDYKKGVKYPDNEWVGTDAREPVEILKEVPVIKDGVDFVFEQHPQLSSIGTQEEYSQYLNTIFPESGMKDIAYHGSKFKFERFDKSKLGSNTNPNKEFPQFNDSYLGFHFTSNPDYYRQRHEFGSKYEKTLNEYQVILNIKNPKELEKNNPFAELTIENIKESDIKNNDSVVYDYLDKVDFTSGEKVNIYTNNYIVFEPEQIHILGTHQDIEKFKEWKSKNLLYQQREYSPNQITPEVKEQLLGFLRNVNPDFRVEVIDNLSVNGLASASEFLIMLKKGKET